MSNTTATSALTKLVIDVLRWVALAPAVLLVATYAQPVLASVFNFILRLPFVSPWLPSSLLELMILAFSVLLIVFTGSLIAPRKRANVAMVIAAVFILYLLALTAGGYYSNAFGMPP